MSTSPVNSPGAADNTYAQTTSKQQASIDALGNPNTFLQLLVAQLKYQDPQNPADGTAFVTQLATFAGVQEQATMRTDLDSINSVAQQWSARQAAAQAAQSNQSTGSSSGNTSSGNTSSGSSSGASTGASNS